MPHTAEPLRLTPELEGEYPDGPRLRVAANRHIRLTQIDYLDERDVKVASERIDAQGQDCQVDINYQELVKISNMKPRNSSLETIHMAFRLHVVDGDKHIREKIPVALQPSFKPINNTSTFFFKVLG